MEKRYIPEQSFIKAQKRVKNIIGFYTHLAATLFIIPFIIFINIELVPEEYHWYWFFIGTWFIGLLLHWFTAFKSSKLHLGKDWKEHKIQELLGEEGTVNFEELEANHTQELFYMKAKKRAKEMKGFYAFLIVNIISIPLIIFINLEFVPGFHFFWFAVIGMLFALFMMWLGIFGLEQLGLGKNWEQRKITEFMKEDYK